MSSTRAGVGRHGRRAAALVAVASVTALCVGGALAATDHASARRNNFVATLNGSMEVPPTPGSPAHGAALFTLTDNGQALKYKITVSNIKGAVEEHIHLGKPGVDGGEPVVAFFGMPAPGVGGEVDTQGYITADNLVGTLAGHPLADLIKQLKNRNAYINVHTVAFPGGEIRGDIAPA